MLYGRRYDNFTEFRRAIDDCLDNIPTKHRPQLDTLMTHNFQRFNPASFLTAQKTILRDSRGAFSKTVSANPCTAATGR